MCAASLIAGAEGSQVRLRVVSGSGRESEMLVRRQPAPPVSKEMLARAEEAAQVFLRSHREENDALPSAAPMPPPTYSPSPAEMTGGVKIAGEESHLVAPDAKHMQGGEDDPRGVLVYSDFQGDRAGNDGGRSSLDSSVTPSNMVAGQLPPGKAPSMSSKTMDPSILSEPTRPSQAHQASLPRQYDVIPAHELPDAPEETHVDQGGALLPADLPRVVRELKSLLHDARQRASAHHRWHDRYVRMKGLIDELGIRDPERHIPRDVETCLNMHVQFACGCRHVCARVHERGMCLYHCELPVVRVY